MAPPPNPTPGLTARRLLWVAAGLFGLVAAGWLLASREEPVPAPVVGAAAATTISARHDTRIVEAAPPDEPELGTSRTANPDLAKIQQAMTPDRIVPSPRRFDDSPREPRFWEPGQDVDAPDAPDKGVAIDGPEAEAVLEQEEWHDAEWFGDDRPLPGEGEP